MLLNSTNRKSSKNEDVEVNLSPLLDMVFILLIFFVVTTTFTRETGVEVKKPQASSSTETREEIIKVAITREGTIHIFEKQVTIDELESILSREVTKNSKTKLVIVADRLAVTEVVVSIIDKANIVGITDTSLASVSE